MAKKNFNRYKEVWDESGKLIENPSKYLNENHTHEISDITGLEEKVEEFEKTSTRLDSHIGNNDVHVSEEDRKKWNNGGVTVDEGLSTISKNPVQNKVISTELNKKVTEETFNEHVQDTNVHVTKEEKEKWNSKSEVTVDDEVTAISDNPVTSKGIAKALNEKANKTELENKVDSSTLELHENDTTSHVTAEERAKWNSKSDVILDEALNATSENGVTNKAIKTELDKKANSDDLADMIDSATYTDHITNMIMHVTNAEKEKWNKILEDAKSYVDSKYGSVDKIDFYVIEDGKSHTDIEDPSIEYIYLEKGESSTQYQSWIYRDGWKNTGADDLNLDNYYKKTETYGKSEVYSKEESYNKDEIDNKFKSFNPVVTVDEGLSTTSKNPVQNKAITEALVNKASTSDLKKKADVSTLEAHTENTSSHVSDEDRKRWNAGNVTIDSSLSSTSTNPVQNKAVTEALANKANSSVINNHIKDTTSHITEAERKKWNDAATSGGSSGISAISKEEGNIITEKSDGIYAESPNLSEYAKKNELSNLISGNDLVSYVKGSTTDYLYARIPEGNILTNNTDQSSFDSSNIKIIPMTDNVICNNIKSDEDGKITLNPNKIYMCKISMRIIGTGCCGIELYDETEQKIYSEFEDFKYSMSNSLAYSNGDSIGIIKTDNKQHVVYPVFSEAYGSVKLNYKTNITIIEIGGNVTVNNMIDTEQIIPSEPCYFRGKVKNELDSSGYYLQWFTSSDIGKSKPLIMNDEVVSNGITISDTGEITLPANKIFLIRLDCRIAVSSTGFMGITIYNKTKDKPFYDVLNSTYSQSTPSTWGPNSEQGILKTDEETVIYPYIFEMTGSKVALSKQSAIVITEISMSNDVTINNTYAGFNETVLFEGKAGTQATTYQLNDSIDNYDLIRVKYKDFSESPAMNQYVTVSPSQLSSVTGALDGLTFTIQNASKAPDYCCQTIIAFKSRDSFTITYRKATTYYDSYITEIIGIKGGESK